MTMNRILTEPPVLVDPYYCVSTPRWVTHLLRLVSLIFAVAVAWVAVTHWSEAPVWVRGLMCVLPPAFLFMALHRRGWAQLSAQPVLCADAEGMYLPGTPPRQPGKCRARRWLLIPWANMTNIRVDRSMTTAGKSACAAFDVQASEEEVEEFLFDNLLHKHRHLSGGVPVAFYVGAFPHPKKVVAGLDALMGRISDPAQAR